MRVLAIQNIHNNCQFRQQQQQNGQALLFHCNALGPPENGQALLFHCNALGEVSGLVYVAASADGYVVGEELQGDYFEDG